MNGVVFSRRGKPQKNCDFTAKTSLSYCETGLRVSRDVMSGKLGRFDLFERE
jgi:hypothetical protein